jgi:hypothetical protein
VAPVHATTICYEAYYSEFSLGINIVPKPLNSVPMLENDAENHIVLQAQVELRISAA